MNGSVDDIIQQIDKLPTINAFAFQVIHLCADKEIPVPRLVKVISADQSLTSQILKVANSSYFNYPRTIYSLDRAIVILGFNLLRDIAVSLAIYSVYKGFKANNYFDLRDLWKHSLISGFALKCLADYYDPENKDILYIGGLLHDIGKLTMIKTMNDDYSMLYEKGQQEGKRIVELEKKYFGFDHAEVGAKLLEAWAFPESIVSMVAAHHQPQVGLPTDKYGPWNRLVYLGNLMAHLIKNRQKDLGSLLNLDPEFSKYFSFSNLEIAELIQNIEEELTDQEGYLMLFNAGTV